MAKTIHRYARRNQFAAAFRDFENGIEEPLLLAELPLLAKELVKFIDDDLADLPHLENLLIRPLGVAIDRKHAVLLTALLAPLRTHAGDIEFAELALRAANAGWVEGYRKLAERGKNLEQKVEGLSLIQAFQMNDLESYDARKADLELDREEFEEWAAENGVSRAKVKKFLANF